MLAAGQKAVDRPLLRHVADELPDQIRFLHRIVPQHSRRAGRWMKQGDQDPERGALACPVGPKQTEAFSSVHVKGKVYDSLLPVIVLGKARDFDGDRPIHYPQPFAPGRSCSMNWSRSPRRRACCCRLSASSKNCFSKGVHSRYVESVLM